MPLDNLDDTDYPVVTCSDFATPSAPGGATTVPLLIVRIQFEGDPYDDNFSGNPYDYNDFYSDACTWAKKIFYNGEEGQLNHYFNSVSYNKFHLTPATETHDNNNSVNDGIITVTLDGNHPNPQSSGDFHSYLVDALSQADIFIDFFSFDSDGNSIVERDELQIMFLVAGYESATTVFTSQHGVWAHKWCIGGQEGVSAPILDGVELLGCSGNGYSRFGERHSSSGHDATIGVIAHELGHAIWLLPDLYDTDSSSAGIGAFGLMGYGTWGYESGENGGETPVHPSAWIKTQVSWVGSTDATSGTNTLYDTAQSGSYNIIKIDIASDTNQFFLLENRSTSGYDKGLYMLNDISGSDVFPGGIAVWHIDEGQSNNDNESRKLVDLEEAADAGLDSFTNYGRSTNLFFSGNGDDPFNDSSSPNSNDYNSSSTGISISNFPAAGDTMSITISP